MLQALDDEAPEGGVSAVAGEDIAVLGVLEAAAAEVGAGVVVGHVHEFDLGDVEDGILAGVFGVFGIHG